MKSQQILPIKNRLDKFQILELEGFRNKNLFKSHFDSSIFTKDELLLKYHNALVEAEQEIKNLRILEIELNNAFTVLKNENSRL